MSTALHPKRLIEVDLPIRKISAHARREKNIPHGQAAAMHIWWARRPLAACRAVIVAAALPAPTDLHCPRDFLAAARTILIEHRAAVGGSDVPAGADGLQTSLLGFIAQFASWECGGDAHFLSTARKLIAAAHQSLSDSHTSRPVLLDPFAGGGAIPIEAVRVGMNASASDLNPVAALLNRVSLQYIPRHGQALLHAVRSAADHIARNAEEALRGYYPLDDAGAVPAAYLWSRIVRCEGPRCGVQIPLLRSPWIVRKSNRSVALSLHAKEKIIEVGLVDNPRASDVARATVQRGAAICPVCAFTTPVDSVRRQFHSRRGGGHDARLLAVVTVRPGERTRSYRLPTSADVNAFARAATDFDQILASADATLFPREELPPIGTLGFRIQRYGLRTWGDLYSPRQGVALSHIARRIRQVTNDSDDSADLHEAVQVILALAFDRLAEVQTSLCRWNPSIPTIQATFGRQALPFVWDFVEASPLGQVVGSWRSSVECVLSSWESVDHASGEGTVLVADAAHLPIPDDSADIVFTDPPYYDAVPYADLSDFFYVWLRRNLPSVIAARMFPALLSPKDEECIVDPQKGKGHRFFEDKMAAAMREARRVVTADGIGVVVFAHKTTAGWEAQLQAMIDAGWCITASWPLDTEMGSRLRARNSAALASSVHLVCRPKKTQGSGGLAETGGWRTVLSELPQRIHEWMPRLADEGVVGADAIFACLGPALEIFSRYSHVEKASGERVPLKEYLEEVWAAVAHEALSLIFDGADASGLEEDARLTAMWLWTLGARAKDDDASPATDHQDGTTDVADDDEESRGRPAPGFFLEYDAARKIAQGLGAHLDKLTDVVEVKGDTARLFAVGERTKALFGKTDRATDEGALTSRKKPSKKQLGLFAEIEAAEKEGLLGEAGVPKVGATTLDRVHQAMILFGAGRSEALTRFVVEEGVGKDARFWKLAQSLSALYPAGTDEKRWVDGVLARKKSLGF